ncbi:MAG: biopolymer transporter ExbD [Firmicutes bacterium]|nr:biopolymer transporter ExbD [Bacillota bacterium]
MLVQRRPRSKPNVQIVPLIDVIFFILVFFMLFTTFRTHPAGLNLELPKSVTSDRQAPTQVVVSISADGRMFLGDRQISSANLKTEVGKTIKNRPDLFVVIKADKNTKYDHVVRVIDDIRQVGGYRFGLAVHPRNPAGN